MSTEADLPGLPPGYGLIHLPQTDSTMREAARRAGSLSGPTWIWADAQTAATGRRGRAWANPPGNLAATLFLPGSDDPAQAALRSFVAALAVHDCIADLAPGAQPALKWPNDVLVRNRKAAGILLESSGRGGRLDWLSIGIGLNLAKAPGADQVEPGATPPIALAEIAAAPTPADALSRLAGHFDRYDRQFRSLGFAPIRSAWLARAARLGEIITARTATTTRSGIFQTIDASGQLILATEAGPVQIAAADIYF